MKVLFVCRANVIRSQMAETWYNLLTGTQNATSAGTVVDEPGQTLGERRLDHPATGHAVDVMLEHGLDMTTNSRLILTKDMLAGYDLVINMAAAKYTPDWLSRAPNYVFWDIPDPLGRGYRATAEACDQIKQKVEALIAGEA